MTFDKDKFHAERDKLQSDLVNLTRRRYAHLDPKYLKQHLEIAKTIHIAASKIDFGDTIGVEFFAGAGFGKSATAAMQLHYLCQKPVRYKFNDLTVDIAKTVKS